MGLHGTGVGSAPGGGTVSVVVRANDLSTKRETAAVYVGRGSAQVLIGVALVLIAARLVVGGFGRGDLIVPIVTVAISGTTEWIIHKFLLHAPDDSWTSRTLGTGVGHKQHHLDPTDLDWLLLRGIDAGVFITALGAVTAAWTLPLMWITGSALFGPFLIGWACAAIGLAHYEWVHLLVHTRYRPRWPYYRGLARNHRLHHYRNERYWLGVTSNTGDRLLRTYPRSKADVPLSDTARTLGA
jgi:hypothetical protein